VHPPEEDAPFVRFQQRQECINNHYEDQEGIDFKNQHIKHVGHLAVARLRGESDVKIVEIIGIAKSVVKLFYNDGVVGGLVCPVLCRYWTETDIPSYSPIDINIVHQA